MRDAFEAENAPRRRMGPHTIGTRLLQAARTRQHCWKQAVAVATWRAEVRRGARQPFDKAVGYAGYEANPFRWQVSQGWLSHSEVTFEWAWWADGGWRRELVNVLAYHLSAHDRGVPILPALKNEEEILRGDLEDVAAKGFTPCEYLGVETGRGF